MLTGHSGEVGTGVPRPHLYPCSLLNSGQAKLFSGPIHRKLRLSQGDTVPTLCSFIFPPLVGRENALVRPRPDYGC